MPIFGPKCRSKPRRPATPGRRRSPARRAETDHRRQMLAERLSRRLRRGRRRRSARPASGPMSPRSAATRSNSAPRPIGRSSATPPTMWSCTFPASISSPPRSSRIRPCGMGVRTARAARDADQSGRDCPDRRKRLAAGEAGRSAQEIATLGKELHSRLATMNEHMARVGKNLRPPTAPTTRWSAASKARC